MSNYRQIHTKIWRDDWFLDLESDEKLLFIYLFSNPAASICGLYELPLKVMEFESGIVRKRLTQILSKFEDAGKVYHRDGLVWVPSLCRYNSTESDKVAKCVVKELEAIKDCELKQLAIQEVAPWVNSLLIPHPYPTDTLAVTRTITRTTAKQELEITSTNVLGAEAPEKPVKKETKSKEPKPLREDQLIWDALVQAGLPAPVTKSERGRWNSAIKELRDAGITAEAIPKLCSAYRARYKDGAELTPTALAGNLSKLIAPSADDIARQKAEERQAVQARSNELKNGLLADLASGKLKVGNASA